MTAKQVLKMKHVQIHWKTSGVEHIVKFKQKVNSEQIALGAHFWTGLIK